MKIPFIDILSLPSIVFYNENSETFFTLLSFVKKAKEITTNFANRSFSYFFITIGNISSNYINFTNTTYNIINTNLFTYIIINQYLSNKFYRIIIDTNIFTHYIMGYRQLISLIPIYSNILQ